MSEDAEIATKKWGAAWLESRGETVEDWRKVRVDMEHDSGGCDTCDYGSGTYLSVWAPGTRFHNFALDGMGGWAEDGQGFQRLVAELLAIEITDEDRAGF